VFKKQSALGNFILGGFAGTSASVLVHPIDVIKLRMQLSGEGGAIRVHKTALHAVYNVGVKEGIPALYKGLTAAALRQITYGSVRLGLYQTLEESCSEKQRRNVFVKLGIGMTSGAFGALAGTPADLALVRMASDGKLPAAERRGYTNVFNALYRICKEESVLTMWRGLQPTVIRAMILNATQLGGYSYFKQTLLQTKSFKDNFYTHFTASMMSGLLCSVASLPVDITKTRLQMMKPVDGVAPYRGTFDCLVKVVKFEGVSALWKGFTPYYLRLGPQTTLSLVFLEQLKKLFMR